MAAKVCADVFKHKERSVFGAQLSLNCCVVWVFPRTQFEFFWHFRHGCTKAEQSHFTLQTKHNMAEKNMIKNNAKKKQKTSIQYPQVKLSANVLHLRHATHCLLTMRYWHYNWNKYTHMHMCILCSGVQFVQTCNWLRIFYEYYFLCRAFLLFL